MRLGKRIAGMALAALVAVGAFWAAPATAQAAAPIAKGIDVSKYQGAVNWTAVKNAGYSFAFVKVGSAKSGLDPYYAVNMAGAAAAGLKVGAYVYSYATTVEGAITEAQFAIAALEPYSVSYPVVFDLEDSVHKNMSPDQLASLAVAFCSTIEQAGYYPMLYSSKNWMVGKIAATPYDKWIAQYNTYCEYPNPAFWQYSSSGQVAGIAGNVDLNYQFKDYSNLIVANGFVDRGGNRYYYKNYRKQYGFIEDNGRRYFMNADGTLYKKGWLGDGVNMMYMDTSDGHMLTDLVTINGKKYYFAADGLMQRGLIPLNGKIYLFGADGAMSYGFYADPTAGTRYFKEDGSMASNELLTINGKKYYFDASGVMNVGMVNIGGATWLFGADGSMQYGWYTDASGMRYFQADGTMAVNTTLTIDGVLYTFDANGLATAVPVLNPAAWVTDPATGVTIDTSTGEVVPAETVAAVAAQAAAAQQ
ncbi:MAG: GH25 family lysozyme [Eubacteriales bacterium]|nr:GH25 family lysozyme [Eubacteriales bacterium]